MNKFQDNLTECKDEIQENITDYIESIERKIRQKIRREELNRKDNCGNSPFLQDVKVDLNKARRKAILDSISQIIDENEDLRARLAKYENQT